MDNLLMVDKTIQMEDSTHPKTKINLDMIREETMTNPAWQAIFMKTLVCRSYPRWANVGFRPVVKPYRTYLGVILDRSSPATKRILIIDPTNAHFQEDATTIPPDQRIFVDVCDEIKKNIGHVVECRCPARRTGGCRCGDGWAIDFVRCKEDRNRDGLSYRRLVDYLSQTGQINTAFSYYISQFAAGGTVTLFGKEDKMRPTYWENELDEMTEIMGERMMMSEMMEVAKMMGVDLGNETGPTLRELKESGRVCGNCWKEDVFEGEELLKRCARCKKVKYCSIKCQKEDWPRHRKFCS